MLLEIEALNLGDQIRAIGMELVGGGVEREPVTGREGAVVWSRALLAVAAGEPIALDFPGIAAGVAEFRALHRMGREGAGGMRIIALPVLEIQAREILADAIEHFEGLTFGMRAGNLAAAPDQVFEEAFAMRGVDAYQEAYQRYAFCAICAFEEASVTLIAPRLWATEVVRRITPAVAGLEVQVRQPV